MSSLYVKFGLFGKVANTYDRKYLPPFRTRAKDALDYPVRFFTSRNSTNPRCHFCRSRRNPHRANSCSTSVIFPLVCECQLRKNRLSEPHAVSALPKSTRSEERRVGKECRSRW